MSGKRRRGANRNGDPTGNSCTVIHISLSISYRTHYKEKGRRAMVSTRSGSRGRNTTEKKPKQEDKNRAGYEESRAQRIRENAERMRMLGIFELSKKLKPSPSPRKTKPKPSAPPDRARRRSSRLKELPQVSYAEKRISKAEEKRAEVEIHLAEGEKPEIYTEEHEKLLGDSKAVWELYVDGYNEEGQRIYDPVQGKSCHQCRQKTLGHHTECSKCKKVSGQFCGDCLYTRYGEHVMEVNENPDWICPVCRGICNCSRCRRGEGWAPTGTIYNKVVALGYKSVAHYLIYNRRGKATIVEGASATSDESLSTEDVKQGSSDASVKEEDGADEEYKGDEH